jgi:Zn-dependent protease
MISFSDLQPSLVEGGLFFLSVLIHEGGHLLAMALLGSGIRGMKFSLSGISLYADTDWLPYRKEAILHLAGPLAGGIACVMTLFLIRRQMTPYRLYFFFTNALLTLLNLVPMKGLDGYGVLLSLSSLAHSREEAERRCFAIHRIALFFLFGIALLFLKAFRNPSLLLLCVALLAEQKRKKATNES